MYLQPVNRLPTPDKTVPLARPFSVMQRWLLCVPHSGSNQRCRMEQVWLQGSWKCIGIRQADSRKKMKGSMHCLCQKIMLPCGTYAAENSSHTWRSLTNCHHAALWLAIVFSHALPIVWVWSNRGPLPVTVIGVAIYLPNLAVLGRNQTLFCYVFPLHYRVRSAVAQYFR